MVGSIDTISASSASVGAVTPQVQHVVAASANGSQSFSSALSSSSNSSAPAAITPASSALAVAPNPRIIQDPQAGFITQYLSANGSQVVSQTPSVITVAYLRLGLTAEGIAKEASYLPVGTTA